MNPYSKKAYLAAERLLRTLERSRQKRRETQAKARSKRRPKCRCAAYPWPHRPGGGLCRYPDPPIERWKGKVGVDRAFGVRYRGIVRTICREYGLNPIRDRRTINRRLPWLLPAWCKRNWPGYYEWLVGNGRLDGRGRLIVKVSPAEDKATHGRFIAVGPR